MCGKTTLMQENVTHGKSFYSCGKSSYCTHAWVSKSLSCVLLMPPSSPHLTLKCGPSSPPFVYLLALPHLFVTSSVFEFFF